MWKTMKYRKTASPQISIEDSDVNGKKRFQQANHSYQNK